MSQNKNEILITIIMVTIAVVVSIITLVVGFIYSAIMWVLTMNQNKK